ncbi:MAG: amidohydrolase, partial [Opitutae bacterium]|nr:amidohydrolase [Opitutae bacterium]
MNRINYFFKPALLTWSVILGMGYHSSSGQDHVQALVGAQLIPISSDPIQDGVLVVQGNKILSVGSAEEVDIPAEAQVRDVSGKVIMPGLVCTHSHIGEVSGGDRSVPIQPEVRALDSINIRETRVEKARAGGITTVNVMSGSGHLLSGQTIYLKLR